MPARADVYDDNLAAASRGAGDIVVLARGADGAVYERHLEGGAWSPWASLGGVATSGPAAAAYGDSIHAFVTGTDGAVYENVLRGGSWTGWISLGGVATSAPSAAPRRGTNLLDLAVRGSDNGLHFRSFQPGAGWSPWSALGGNLTSGPSVNSQDPGTVNVYFRGTDGQLVQKAWDGSAWLDWIYLGGLIAGAPSAIAAPAEHGRRVRPRRGPGDLPEALAGRRGLERMGPGRPEAARLDAGRGLGHGRSRAAVRALGRGRAVQGVGRRTRMGRLDAAGARSRHRLRHRLRHHRRPTASPSSSRACAARRRAGACA